MTEVLFVSKPVAWNDSSKNLVRDIAGHLQRHSPVLMGHPGQASPIDRGRVEAVYGPASAETNGEALAEAIEGLSTDEAWYADVGQKARALATSKFSPQEVAAAYELLYEEIHG